MADMLNHKRPNETSWTFDNGKNGFTITTTKKLLRGAQVCVCVCVIECVCVCVSEV
jgi:hypothetical protein